MLHSAKSSRQLVFPGIKTTLGLTPCAESARLITIRVRVGHEWRTATIARESASVNRRRRSSSRSRARLRRCRRPGSTNERSLFEVLVFERHARVTEFERVLHTVQVRKVVLSAASSLKIARAVQPDGVAARLVDEDFSRASLSLQDAGCLPRQRSRDGAKLHRRSIGELHQALREVGTGRGGQRHRGKESEEKLSRGEEHGEVER